MGEDGIPGVSQLVQETLDRSDADGTVRLTIVSQNSMSLLLFSLFPSLLRSARSPGSESLEIDSASCIGCLSWPYSKSELAVFCLAGLAKPAPYVRRARLAVLESMNFRCAGVSITL